MEPISLMLLGLVVFGVISTLTFFIRQLFLSRNKSLNEAAQTRAISREAEELFKLREQMQTGKRFDAHHKLLGENRASVEYIDGKISDILEKKLSLVERYIGLIEKIWRAMIEGDYKASQASTLNDLKEEVDVAIVTYDKELLSLQKRRSRIWDVQSDLLKHLSEGENDRNDKLNALYEKHTEILDKMYLKQSDSNQSYAEKSLETGAKEYQKNMEVLENLAKRFEPSKYVQKEQFSKELSAREKVSEAQENINSPGSSSLSSQPDSSDGLSVGTTS